MATGLETTFAVVRFMPRDKRVRFRRRQGDCGRICALRQTCDCPSRGGIIFLEAWKHTARWPPSRNHSSALVRTQVWQVPEVNTDSASLGAYIKVGTSLCIHLAPLTSRRPSETYLQLPSRCAPRSPSPSHSCQWPQYSPSICLLPRLRYDRKPASQ
jgi:hypothetical protein